MSTARTRPGADSVFLAAALLVHMVPVAFVAWLLNEPTAGVRDQAMAVIPLAGLTALAQIALAVADRRTAMVGLSGSMRGGWTLTLPIWAVIAAIFVGAAVGGSASPGLGTLGVLVIAMALVAFNEEFTFRGAIMGVVLRHGSPAVAVGVSAVAFGLAHYVALLGAGGLIPTSRQVAAAALFGVALGLIRLKMPSLWPLVGMHAMWNVAVLTAGDTATVASEGAAGTVLRAVGATLILAAIAGVVVKALRQRGAQRPRSAAR